MPLWIVGEVFGKVPVMDPSEKPEYFGPGSIIPLPDPTRYTGPRFCEISTWSFVGVFDTEQRAVEVAMEREAQNYTGKYRFFVGPAELNVPFPLETIDWPDGYYPAHRVDEALRAAEATAD